MKLKKIEEYETDNFKIIILVDIDNPNRFAQAHIIPNTEKNCNFDVSHAMIFFDNIRTEISNTQT